MQGKWLKGCAGGAGMGCLFALFGLIMMLGPFTIGALFTTTRQLGRGSADALEATFERPAASPSGKFRLVVLQGDDGQARFQQFQILTTEEPLRLVFASEDRFRMRDATFFCWDAADRVWVYSGDVGAFYWLRSADGRWEKKAYAPQGSVSAPSLLKARRPRAFPR